MEGFYLSPPKMKVGRGFGGCAALIRPTQPRHHRRPDKRSRRAIQCKEAYGHATEPWTTWAILCDIETDAGQPQAAQQARRQAVALFLAYRRDGGESHTGSARLCAAVAQALAEGKGEEALAWVDGLRDEPDLPAEVPPLLDALQAIIQGHRAPALADDPKLSYNQAVEILLLLERLPPPAKPGLFAKLGKLLGRIQ